MIDCCSMQWQLTSDLLHGYEQPGDVREYACWRCGVPVGGIRSGGFQSALRFGGNR